MERQDLVERLAGLTGGLEPAQGVSAEDLREALSAAVAGGCKRVLIDLQESDHIDPLVLGAILGSQRRLSHFGGDMAVVCASYWMASSITSAATFRHFRMCSIAANARPTWAGSAWSSICRGP